MKGSKKLVSVLLVLTMLSMLLVGCGKKNDNDTGATSTPSENTDVTNEKEDGDTNTEEEPEELDISEEVVLKMYCIGDEGGIYSDQVLENLNAILKEKINARIEPLMVSWGEYRDKLPLIYASGEAYDLVYVANWCNYAAEAVKGPFLELSELMPIYAPNTYAELEANGTLETAKVNGSLYMVPSTAPDYTTHAFMWRDDLRKKYNLPEITDWETLETYMDAILENEPEMLPMAMTNTALLNYVLGYENDWARPIAGGSTSGVVSYNITDGTDIFNLVETPEYEAFVNRQREWYQKGYWSRSVLSETTQINDQFLAGKSAVTIVNKNALTSNYVRVNDNNPEWEIDYKNFDKGLYEKIVPTNNGVAIGINSKNPERALMFMELMNQDEEAFRAMFYGIEDTTYVITEDGKKANPDGVDPSTLNLRNLGMGIQVGKFVLDDANHEQRVLDEFDSYDSNSTYPALAAFVVDDTEISAELAAIANVVDEYKRPLDLGVIDPATGLPELKEKLKQAGIDKVMAEIREQLVEFNAQ
jgi:putative aldouronate transport system substrate-binding protein